MGAAVGAWKAPWDDEWRGGTAAQRVVTCVAARASGGARADVRAEMAIGKGVVNSLSAKSLHGQQTAELCVKNVLIPLCLVENKSRHASARATGDYLSATRSTTLINLREHCDDY